MQIEYTGRQTNVTAKLRALAERRLRKLAKVLRSITHAHVILSVDKHRQVAEVSVHSPHMVLTAQEQTADMTASLGNALDKLERQALRQAGKRKQRKRQGPVRDGASTRRAGAVWKEKEADAPGREQPVRAERALPPRAPAGPRLIRSRRVPLRPLTVQQAMLEVEDSKDGLLVYRDATTERMTVLFKRKDGNLGLIEPEA
jgi:ribosome hibernation promoting factor